MRLRYVFLAAAVAAMSTGAAQASLTISDQPTANIACHANTCTSTAGKANLNASELMSMLADGNVRLASERKARDIEILVPVTWAGDHRLTLESFHSVVFKAPVIDEGPGDVVLTTGDRASGAQLQFIGEGRLAFWDVGAGLSINGQIHMLAFGIAGLAQIIAVNPDGLIVLANDYDAAADGTYPASPIAAAHFKGTLDGLGNTIRRLKIRGQRSGQMIALVTENFGTIRNLHLDESDIAGGRGSIVGGIVARNHIALQNVTVSGRISGGAGSFVGGICGALDSGFIASSSSSGSVAGSGSNGSAGGLVGSITGSAHISASFSVASVTGGKKWRVGGLVGQSAGYVETAYASGNVTVGDKGFAGGLIGDNSGSDINYAYADGAVTGGLHATVGGLLGRSQGGVVSTYSSGTVAGGSGNATGGFVGTDAGVLKMQDDYWDVTSSGRSQGAGNDSSDPGITGLTTEEFQAGLPPGFAQAVWAQQADINGGRPYLRALPPH